METVEQPLMNHGLMIMQPIYEGCLMTRIIDIESEKEVFVSSLELPKLNDPQKVGSAITYFRRYTLQSLLGINSHDDDGNYAAKPTRKPEPDWDAIAIEFKNAKSVAEIKTIWSKHKNLQKVERFINLKESKKNILSQNGITE